jgi:hypothetical protein
MFCPISLSEGAAMTQVAAPEYQHRTVLLDEAVDALNLAGPRADGIYIDGTFGRGGHSRLILSRLGAKGRLFGFDKDLQAIATAEQIDDPRFTIVHDSFATMRSALAERGVTQVDGILLDLGISSPFQLPQRRPARHAHGHHARHVGGPMAGHRNRTTTGKGDTRLWGRTVCFSDCKGDCCSPGNRANFKHTTACRYRGKRGQDTGKGQGSGHPYLSGYPDFHQSGA